MRINKKIMFTYVKINMRVFYLFIFFRCKIILFSRNDFTYVLNISINCQTFTFTVQDRKL